MSVNLDYAESVPALTDFYQIEVSPRYNRLSMDTWVSHCHVAELLLEQMPNLNAQQFVIGNVFPDSGHSYRDWTRSEPP